MKRWLLALVAFASLGVGEGLGEWRPPDAGVVDNPFALAGDVITEDSLPLIRDMRMIESLPGNWTTYYFSSAAGGDYPAGSATGDGTKAEPFDTSLIDNYCIRPNVLCLLDSGETFVFAATITFSTTACATDDPCSIITTSGPQKAILTTAGTAATDGPIFSNQTTTGGGWPVVANLRIVSNEVDTDGAGTADNMDVFTNNSSAGGNGKYLSIGNDIELTGDTSDNCWTSHRDGQAIILGGSCALTVGSTGTNPPWAFTNGSDVLMIGTDLADSSTVAHDGVVLDTSSVVSAVDPATLTIIDSLIDRGAVTGAGESAIELNPSDSETLTVRLAKVGITASAVGSECIRTVLSTAGDGLNLFLNQVTMTACQEGLSSISGALDAAAVLGITADGITCDAMGGRCVNLADSSWATALTMDLRRWIYDSSDSATELFVTAGAAASPADTATDFQTDIDSVVHTGTISVNASTATDSNDAQVQWSDGTTARTGLDCDAINDCWQAYDVSYSVPFHDDVPEWVFGSTVRSAALGGTNRNIGR